MSALDCWNAIYESGHVRVDPPTTDAPPDEPALTTAIVRLDAEWRHELPGEPPALVTAATAWALSMVHRACQYMVYREVNPDVVEQGLAKPCPFPASPDVCYSVDLALRVLPQLLRLARATSPDDPLVRGLQRLARTWPLSSVGETIDDADLTAFIEHPTLRQLYVDRIIAAGDASRLTEARVRESARAAVGAYPHLAASSIVAALKEHS